MEDTKVIEVECCMASFKLNRIESAFTHSGATKVRTSFGTGPDGSTFLCAFLFFGGIQFDAAKIMRKDGVEWRNASLSMQNAPLRAKVRVDATGAKILSVLHLDAQPTDAPSSDTSLEVWRDEKTMHSMGLGSMDDLTGAPLDENGYAMENGHQYNRDTRGNDYGTGPFDYPHNGPCVERYEQTFDDNRKVDKVEFTDLQVLVIARIVLALRRSPAKALNLEEIADALSLAGAQRVSNFTEFLCKKHVLAKDKGLLVEGAAEDLIKSRTAGDTKPRQAIAELWRRINDA